MDGEADLGPACLCYNPSKPCDIVYKEWEDCYLDNYVDISQMSLLQYEIMTNISPFKMK